MYVCICVHVFMYGCMCSHSPVCVYIHINVCVYMCICMCLCVYMSVYMCVCMYVLFLCLVPQNILSAEAFGLALKCVPVSALPVLSVLSRLPAVRSVTEELVPLFWGLGKD